MNRLKFIIAAILLVIIVVTAIVLAIPKKESDFISTDIAYSEGRFNVVYNDYAIYNGEEKTEIFKIDRKKSKLKEYFTFDEANELIDAKQEKLLLKDKKGYFLFDLKSKKIVRYSTKDIPLNSDFNNITCSLSADADRLIVTKVLTDSNKAVKAGKIVLGYKLKAESGVYIYSAEKGKEISKVGIDKFGIEDTKKLKFFVCYVGKEEIGLVLRESAIGTSFQDEHYYTVKNGKCSKIGSYSNSESLDPVNCKFNFNNYYINMNTSSVIAVDFENKIYSKNNTPSVRFGENAIIYLRENADSFIVSKTNGLGYWECTIKDGGISFKDFSSSQLEKHNFAVSELNVGANIEPSSKLLEKLEGKKTDGIYKTYSDSCYLVNLEDKFCIIYK